MTCLLFYESFQAFWRFFSEINEAKWFIWNIYFGVGYLGIKGNVKAERDTQTKAIDTLSQTWLIWDLLGVKFLTQNLPDIAILLVTFCWNKDWGYIRQSFIRHLFLLIWLPYIVKLFLLVSVDIKFILPNLILHLEVAPPVHLSPIYR